MKILVNNKGVVVAKGELQEFNQDEKNAGYSVANGSYKINNRIYPEHLNLQLKELDLDPEVQKHKIENDLIVENLDYVKHKSKDEKILELEAKVAELEALVK